MKVRVLEELREKVVSLKAEVDVGRQGCDACKFRVSLSSIFSCMLTNLFPRANNNIAVAGVDLMKKIEVDVRREILKLKQTLNGMMKSLSVPADEVACVVKVGMEGR